MVNIKRSHANPEILNFLAHQKGLKKGTYENAEIGKLLKADFHGKCYLCQEKITTYEIEHFRPHQKKNKVLKFDWNNLYFSCGHCNNTKSDSYNTNENNEILDCCNANHDLNNWIKYEIKESLIKKVIVTAVDNQLITKNTVRLLQSIYDGTTDHKENEAETLRDKIWEDICNFERLLIKYLSKRNERTFESIKREIKSESQFCAFKRWIIKSKPAYQIFEPYFD